MSQQNDPPVGSQPPRDEFPEPPPGYQPTQFEEPDTDKTPADYQPTALEEGEEMTSLGIPAGDIEGYVCKRSLAFGTTEAEVYLAEHRDRDERRAIKIYKDRNCRVDEEVLAKLQNIDLAHVPQVHGWGRLEDGRFYEILEYIEGGTLDDLLDRGIPDEDLSISIIRELVSALRSLSDAGIVHRDIKPANILIRDSDPLDLVLTDFGLARVTGGNLYRTKLGETVLYSPPEGGQFAHRNRDWWSLGIIAVKLRVGRHPWENVEATHGSNAVIIAKTFDPAPVPDEMGERWQLLVKGLNTRNGDNRWAAPEVERWLNGEKDIPVHFETESRRGSAADAYVDYDNRRIFRTPAEIAVALADEDWRASERFLMRYGAGVAGWLRSKGREESARALDGILEDHGLGAGEKVSAAIWLLDEEDVLGLKSQGGIRYCGRLITRADMPAAVAEPARFAFASARDVLELVDSSALGSWQSRLCGESWLTRLRGRRNSFKHIAESSAAGESLRRPLADILSVSPQADVIEEGAKIKAASVYSPIAAVNEILGRKSDQPSLGEAWLLASMDASVLFNRGQDLTRRLQERFDALHALWQAHSARRLLGFKPEFPYTAMAVVGGTAFVYGAIRISMSVNWASWFVQFTDSRDPLFQSFALIALWWFACVPLAALLVTQLCRSAAGRMLFPERRGAEIPKTDGQWREEFEERQANAKRALGRDIGEPGQLRREWRELKRECAGREYASDVVVPRPGARGLMATVAGLYALVVLSFFLLPDALLKDGLLGAWSVAIPSKAVQQAFHATSSPRGKPPASTPSAGNARSPVRETRTGARGGPSSLPAEGRKTATTDARGVSPVATPASLPFKMKQPDWQPPAKDARHSRPPGRYPQTASKLLTERDIEGMSLDQIQYAINEMFARYGADFNGEVRRQFQRFSWYRPRAGLGFNQVEHRYFSPVERENLKLLAAARNAARSGGSVAPPSSGSGSASSRPSSNSRFVTTRQLKDLAGKPVGDTWFYGDFIASRVSGNTVVMYPIWMGGFVRGHSTEIRATFRNGVPAFPGLDRLPMHSMDSNVAIKIDQKRPLRITSVKRARKPGSSKEIVIVRAVR